MLEIDSITVSLITDMWVFVGCLCQTLIITRSHGSVRVL